MQSSAYYSQLQAALVHTIFTASTTLMSSLSTQILTL